MSRIASVLLPMPLLSPWAWEATLAACAIFPHVGVLRDLRQTGKVHPAWMWGLGAMAGCLVMTELITYSPVGMTLYRQATAGSPGAAVATNSSQPDLRALALGGCGAGDRGGRPIVARPEGHATRRDVPWRQVSLC